ncbi:MAG: BsaWI family type II restriction enzyme [Candidatus Zeuxoniibacter abyssi]|nr:MAG: BsaWI family type II restriction enzyme [Candidatus Persebacteraceae bacterium AB1(2)]
MESKQNQKTAWRNAFDQIHDVMTKAKDDVEKMLAERKKEGKIEDIRQAMKSIAGNAFSNTIVFIFLKNKIMGNIKPDIYITAKKSQVKNFENIATIYVNKETQKPDVDLIVFTKEKDESVKKCMILSLKTSLRERAGQTYKWKLLMEIASTDNPVKKKYNISYAPKHMPLVAFATVNFYDEINQPQHRGMFKFFDKSFIAKPINENFISRLSKLVDFANEKL